LRVILSGGGAGFAPPESKDLLFLSPALIRSGVV
jgi:hypothetical protein